MMNSIPGGRLMDDMRRDLVGAVALAVLCAIGVLVFRVTPVRAVLAVPLCLLLPGYLIREAIFGSLQLEPGSRLMLVPALSLITLILSSLLLNEFPGGLQPGTWVGWLLFVEIVAALVTDRRRGAAGSAPMRGVYRRIRLRPVDAVVLGLALAVAIAAYVATRLPLSAKNVVGYETLTLVPNRADTGIVVSAKSGREHTYRYVLDVDVAGRRVASRALRLAPGAVYDLNVGLGSSTAARNVSATLQIIGASSPTRQVNLLLAAPKRRAKENRR